MTLLATYTLAILLGSALLFLVQPMVAKMILPSFGGAPAVWNTCLVFFQAVLLAGYAYAHFATRWLGPRRQSILHLAVLAVAAAFVIRVPEGYDPTSTGLPNTVALLALLGVVVGVPFFAVSAGAPIVQRWFSGTEHKDAADPYFLYAASNLGSLVALLGYPLLVEPMLTLEQQSRFWRTGFLALLGVMFVSAILMWRARPPTSTQPVLERIAPSWRNRLGWIALAAVPSSLLIGVTSFLTANIAAIPLLWVIPLSLYLLTYAVAFRRKPLFGSKHVGWVMGLLAVAMALIVSLGLNDPMPVMAFVHLSFFTAAALFCHMRLAESRPAVGDLTEFYLYLSLGGVIGGAFSALLAPAIFSNLAEYPITIAAALLFRAQAGFVHRRLWMDFAFAAIVAGVAVGTYYVTRQFALPSGPPRNAVMLGVPILVAFLSFHRPVRYALSICAILLVSMALNTSISGRVISENRSFFGVHRVVQYSGGLRSLIHGTTLHGRQNLTPGLREVPLTYYHPTGPMGDVFRLVNGSTEAADVGLVGLGVGSLAAYGREGDDYAFFEIDPLVVRIARDSGYFTYLRDSNADIRIVLGDARLTIDREPPASFDLLVIDAFSSDAIPVHLLTIEAMRMYLSKLRQNGLLAVHISNRYVDLRDPVARAARVLGLEAWLFQESSSDISPDHKLQGKTPSTWVLMAAAPRAITALGESSSWVALEERRPGRVWTDDYSNVVGAFYRSE